MEVTLTQYSGGAKEPKACWYPFQKQRNNRRGEIWDVDETPSNTKVDKSSRLNICSTSSSDKRAARKEKMYQKKNSKSKTGSVSTGTEADNSFLSDETRTTVKTGASSQGTPRMNSQTHSSPSHRLSLNDQHSMAGFSNQANSIAATPRRFPKRQSKYVQSPMHFNQQVRPQSTQPKVPKAGSQELDGVYKADNLAEVETNCISKDFWADEGINCSEARRKRHGRERAVQNMRLKDVTLTKSPKGVEGIGEPSVEEFQKPTQPSNAASGPQLSSLLRFVTQDPEVANDATPFRRILCSSVPFRNGSAPMICHDRRAIPKQQGRQDANVFQILHRHGEKMKDMPAHDLEEEEPNFYVEVQAMREQLNNIRDLEDIKSEAKQSTSSTVDRGLQKEHKELLEQDKELTSPSNRERQPLTDSAIDERFRAHVQQEREKRQQDGGFEPKRTSSTPRLSTPQRQAQFRSRIREKIARQNQQGGRQNQLLNEMVSDRVLSMAGSEIASSAFRNSTTNNDFVARQSTFKTSNQVKSRTNDDFVTRQSTLKTSNQVHSRRVALMDEVPPHVPMKANYAPHMNSLADTSSRDFSEPDSLPTNVSNIPDRDVLARDVVPNWDKEEKKEEWQESDIGFYRKLKAPPQIHNTASSHKRTHMSEEIFDDNFWKEDNSDINTAAFEEFGSEVNSGFDDIKGDSSLPRFAPRSTQEIFDSFEQSYQDSFGFDSTNAESKSTGKRTTYLQ